MYKEMTSVSTYKYDIKRIQLTKNQKMET